MASPPVGALFQAYSQHVYFFGFLAFRCASSNALAIISAIPVFCLSCSCMAFLSRRKRGNSGTTGSGSLSAIGRPRLLRRLLRRCFHLRRFRLLRRQLRPLPRRCSCRCRSKRLLVRPLRRQLRPLRRRCSCGQSCRPGALGPLPRGHLFAMCRTRQSLLKRRCRGPARCFRLQSTFIA